MLKTFSIPFIMVTDIKKLLHFYRFPKSLCFGNLFTINTKIGTQKMQYGNETQIFSLIKNLPHSFIYLTMLVIKCCQVINKEIMNASRAKVEAKKAKLETYKNCNLFCSKNCNDIMILRQK